MIILAIETSCDDTCAAVLKDTAVLSSVISSQIDLHKEWGGVVPDLARRAHEQRIGAVVAEAIKRSKISNFKFKISKLKEEERIEKIIDKGMEKIDVIAVTQGPGLAPALGVGVKMARELALKYGKKLVAVNHIEGHLMSNWVQNSQGKPKRKFEFPALSLTVSGGHSKIIMIKGVGDYKILGETLDDAAGEALDKAAKMLGLGYPGGPVIEVIAQKGNSDFLKLPRPLSGQKNFDYSFSGLKTSFYYQIREWPAEKVAEYLADLAASFQRAVFETLLMKFDRAIEATQPKLLLASGGVMANETLRKMLRALAKKRGLRIYMPYKKQLNTDNAAMVGTAGYFKSMKGEYFDSVEELDRNPRMKLGYI